MIRWAYEPLVNLGGVLVTLNKLDEAWKFNGFAVLERPGDALANSQMGMTYFGLGDFDRRRAVSGKSTPHRSCSTSRIRS